MNCLESTVKYILYIFNILFMIAGVLLIVMGSIMLSDMGHFKTFKQAINTETIPIIIIVLGGVIFLISFFGCFGAMKENVCCESIYAIFVFVLFCLQVVLVVWIFVRRSEFIATMSDVVQIAWNENVDGQQYPMDDLQLAFDCCGLNSYLDYGANNLSVPSSCCGDVKSTSNCPTPYYTLQPGCRHEFMYFWENTLDIIRWGGLGVAIVELIAFLFAVSVISSIHRPKTEVYEVEVRT